MKSIFMLATILSFTWLIVTLLRLPSGKVPWPVVAYLLLHAAFVVATWWTAKSIGLDVAAGSPVYKRAYAIYGLPVILGMLFVAGDFATRSFGAVYGLTLFCACVSGASSVALIFMHEACDAFHLPNPTLVIVNHLTLGAALAACGIATFSSLLIPSGSIECSVKLAISSFWLSFAFYQFFYAIGVLNPHVAWITRQDWIPTFAALVCCVWLSLKLNSSQRELTYEPLPSVQFSSNVLTSPIFKGRTS